MALVKEEEDEEAVFVQSFLVEIRRNASGREGIKAERCVKRNLLFPLFLVFGVHELEWGVIKRCAKIL